MASALHVFFLLCGISGLLTGAWSWPQRDNRDGYCPKGWTQLDDLCYILQEEPRSFADAERLCNILGGNLASITSALNNAVVYQLLVARDELKAWIGLSDAVQENTFFWNDGKLFGFDNFGPDEPKGVGDCVLIYISGQWYDCDCADEYPYVCIREASLADH
ncbi:ladderlectin-like [Dunckerocampus dactyliophorus]|uniref:ladderlectin-like n=1 Tax=Dunckerocampus dactyliophorus TaxID=161453 RepID=UPI002405E6B9|nr:ladderlectin-like [Dunckerocampus dactyliophorus]